jgi:2-amino-4-hydroxy-6-hydroxymethyldihydropteridine diphosphokinase
VTQVFLALGGNLGDRLANLRAAVAALNAHGLQVRTSSSIWETEPVPADQPAYLNAVVSIETDVEPHDLLDILKEIEAALGRRPGRRWGPRPVDLDILFYGAERFESARLTIPHLGIASRHFVLAPLAEVLPGPLPILAESAQALLDQLPPAGLLEIVAPSLIP